MTISLKADASGNSGAIQVSGNDKLIVNADGSLVATVNPATGVRSNALATMQKFADEFAASLAGNGYQKLPSGLIIQWGAAAVDYNGSYTAVTFPIAFPQQCFSVVLTARGYVENGVIVPSVPIPTKTGFSIYGDYSQTAGGTIGTHWIAIGN